MKKKVKKIGVYNADIVRYIPGTLALIFQEMLQKVWTIEQPAHPSHNNKQVLYFVLIVDKNYNTNLKNVHVCFLIRFRKLTNAATNLANDLIPVNSFLEHWV